METAMLDRAHRLRRRGDFAAAIRGGRRAGRGTLVVHLLRVEAATPPRAGFIVPRTVGGAVVRNTVRRRLRHLVRDRLADLPPGTSLVVRALPAAATASSARLAADLTAALRAAAAGSGRRRAATAAGSAGDVGDRVKEPAA
jgi:ribonuclease P protein component